MRDGRRGAWIAVGVGIVAGVLIGRWIYGIAEQPNLVAMYAWLAAFGLLVLVAAMILVGVVLLVFGDREAGGLVMVVAISAGVGASLAYMYRDGIQIVSERAAQIEVTLAPPIDEPFSGRGTCFTVANGDDIRRIEGSHFITAGGVNWRASLVLDTGEFPQHRIAILPEDDADRIARYLTGIVSGIEVDAAADGSTGSVKFSDLQADPGRQLMNGEDGPTRLGGSMTWACD